MVTTTDARSEPTPTAARIAAAIACAIVAAIFAAWGPLAVQDPVVMPTVPPWVAAAAAAVAAVLLLPDSVRSARWRGLAVAVAVSVMLAGSLLALPHTVLMVIVRAGQMLTGGSGSFPVEPSWLATLAHGANVVAAVLSGRFLLLDRRVRRGVCAKCGRERKVPPAADAARWLRPLAVLTVGSALPYGALKLAWSVGSDLGLTGDGFEAVTLTSPGFGDTVLLTALAVAVALAMGARVAHRGLRPVLLLIGSCASLMLLPVGATAMVQMISLFIGGGSIDDSQIAPWAFGLVYASFILWGTVLAALTLTYWWATRPLCSAHFVPAAVPPIAGRPAS